VSAPLREIVGLLGFDVDQRSVQMADRHLTRYQQRVAEVAAAQQRMSMGLWTGLAAAVVGNAWYQANSQAQSLRASLDLVTGGAEGTARAMAFVQEFALQSPDSLGQVTAAYQMLLAQGLDPTTERMTALGDSAAAAQTDIQSLTEAMMGGAIGNTERLDMMFGRFGMNFTSRQGTLYAEVNGELKRVGENFAEISAFIENEGRTRFAGGMANLAATMSGQLGMLADAANKFLVAMGDAGLRDAFTELTQAMTATVDGGNSLARLLGITLSKAVRMLARGMEWLAQNQDKVQQALAWLSVWVAGSTLVTLINMLRQITVSMALIGAEALLVQFAIGAAFIGAFLIIDDFFAFLEGRPSVMGVIAGANRDKDGIMGDLARFFDDLREHGGEALRLLAEDIGIIWETFDAMWQDLSSMVSGMASMMQPVLDWLDRLKDRLDGLISPELRQLLQFLQDYAPVMNSPAGRIARAFRGDFTGLTGGDTADAYANLQWLRGRRDEVGPDGRPMAARFGGSLPETMAVAEDTFSGERLARAQGRIADGRMGPFGWIPGAGKSEGRTVTVAPANVTINMTVDSPDVAEAAVRRLRTLLPSMIEEAFEPAFERAIADGGLE
jgi:hypothetical protein